MTRTGITLKTYNRRWDAIMHAFRVGALTPAQASAAVADLTGLRPLWHVPPKRRAVREAVTR